MTFKLDLDLHLAGTDGDFRPATDFARWAEALLNRRLVSEQSEAAKRLTFRIYNLSVNLLPF